MISFFGAGNGTVIAVKAKEMLSAENISALGWLFGNATQLEGASVEGKFIGPRR